jgi:hypothetical protein
MAVADDLERLHERDTGGQHGGELATEYRDVARLDLVAARKQLLALLANACRHDALAPEFVTYRCLIVSQALALDFLAVPVGSFPQERRIAYHCCLRHVLSPLIQ